MGLVNGDPDRSGLRYATLLTENSSPKSKLETLQSPWRVVGAGSGGGCPRSYTSPIPCQRTSPDVRTRTAPRGRGRPEKRAMSPFPFLSTQRSENSKARTAHRYRRNSTGWRHRRGGTWRWRTETTPDSLYPSIGSEGGERLQGLP